jgi:hypothetical protein
VYKADIDALMPYQEVGLMVEEPNGIAIDNGER